MNTTAHSAMKPRIRNAKGGHAHRYGRDDARGANFKLSSRDVAKDLFEDGGIPLLMSALPGHGPFGHGRRTVRGRAVTKGARQKRNEDQRVVHPGDRPFSAIGGVAGLRGNLACTCALVKVAAMADLKSAEPARFDGEEARFRTVKNKKYRESEVLVIRNERPQHGPWMREALATREAVARVFHGFFQGSRAGVHHARA